MDVRIDHIVLWVEEPLRSVEFYEKVLGFSGVRVEEFKAGTCPFPSVRVADDAILDLMTTKAAPMLDAMPGAEGSAGHKVNHVCFAMSRAAYDALRARVESSGQQIAATMKSSFGAQGHAPEAFYFRDPDGNILEARYYGANE